ncbi:unnamed protein product [Diabrotica balteata]|uniref:Endonuclease-reverse transcriptase n=1 Tax=Diabrotica balteata TaxID=107213 RepID=A0A9N9X8L5_DIABA|nr:unnamed protein product [Diabrotica balteata]
MYTTLSNASKNMGLQENEKKTKIMASTPNNRARNIGHQFTVDNSTFKVVDKFTYLGSLIIKENVMTEEIKQRIILANKCYFGLSRHMRSRNLSQKTKITIYKTLIQPVLIYGSETWTISKADENLLLIFERRSLRRIFGGICEKGIWRRRYKYEIYHRYKYTFGGKDVVSLIKIGRLRWAGHLARSQQNNPPRRILMSQPVESRSRGRPKLRWRDGVDEDGKKIGAANWQQLAMDRTDWHNILGKVEALL